MSSALQSGALLCTAFGLVSGGAALLSTREGVLAVKVLLDLLLAAGLLRLSDDPSATAIATAGAIVVLRKVVSTGLTASRAARRRTA